MFLIRLFFDNNSGQAGLNKVHHHTHSINCAMRLSFSLEKHLSLSYILARLFTLQIKGRQRLYYIPYKFIPTPPLLEKQITHVETHSYCLNKITDATMQRVQLIGDAWNFLLNPLFTFFFFILNFVDTNPTGESKKKLLEVHHSVLIPIHLFCNN